MIGRLERLRPLIVIASLLVLAIGAIGALRLDFDSDSRVYFDLNSPDRQALDALEQRHGRFTSVVFLVTADNGDIYTEGALAAVDEVVRRLDDVPEAVAVSALTELAGGSTDPATVRTGSQDNPRAAAPLVADDGTATAVIATLQSNADGERTNWDVTSDLKTLRDAVVVAHPGIDIAMTGSAVLDATFIEALRSDLPRLVPAQVALLTVLLVVTLGSMTATLALFAVLGIATAASLGLAGWLGMTLNGVTSAVPTVLMGLAVATSVHIILAWQHALRDDPDVRRAVARAVDLNARPVTLAIATTVVSFLCLNFSTSPPFREFGNLVAFGLAVTWVLSFTLLPTLMLVMPPSRARSRQRLENAMAGLGTAVLKSRAAVLVVTAIVAAAAVFGLTRLEFDDTFAHYFDHRFEFRRATDLYQEKLSGITVVQLSVPAAGGSSFATRAGLADLRDLVDWLEARARVDRVTGVLDVVGAAGRRAPGVLDDRGLPTSDPAAAALVDAYRDGAMPGTPPGLLGGTAAFAHLSIVLGDISSTELIAFAETVNAELDARFGPGSVRVAGPPILAAHLSSTNTQAMFVGTLVALAAISTILAFALGGLRMGVVSLVPNLVPLVLAYGLWGLAFGEVSFAATVVVAMTFGIVVDDTVHIMSRYRRLRNGGLAPAKAVTESLRTVGVAVVITSISIASGFAVLAFSGFLVNHHLGLLTVITLAAALLTDLLLLPLLLVLADRVSSRPTR